ncbi:hypothetical protein CGCF415_v013798 [Colletotrichum fructicola]|nr:hypothetical protein CGCF415_v013798 [Colletotrichum fructicola]KAF4932219.1 hypothetical protein CGCF245_v010865 [Colletotrichum fructicola]
MVLAMLPSLWDLTSHQDRSAALKKSGNGHKNCRFGSNVQPHLKIGLDKQVPEIPNVGAQVDENQGVHHGNLQELAASHKPQAGPREARLPGTQPAMSWLEHSPNARANQETGQNSRSFG